MMHLSILTPFVPERLERAEDLAIRRIQLRIGPGFPISTEEPSLDEAKRAADALEERGFTVAAIGFYRNMIEPDAGLRALESARLYNVLRMAAEVFHVKVVSVFAGRHPELGVEENMPLLREVWTPLVHAAEERGLRLAMENCSMYRGYPVKGINVSHTPDAYGRIFEAIPSTALGIEFDPSHCVKERIDALRMLRDFAPCLYSFHAKDHRRDPELEYRHGCYDPRVSTDRFPGFGEVDFSALIGELHRIGYDGEVILEAERDPDFTTEPRIREGLRASAGLLRALLGN